MTLNTFSKMHGLGNDFIVINALDTPFDWTAQQITALADRHCGIGFDQLLIIEPASVAGCDFAYRIFNADGSEVEHCGNGARCFGKYIRDHGLLPDRANYRVQVKKGVIDIRFRECVDGIDYIQVDMGEPDFQPMTAAQISATEQPITLDNDTIEVAMLSMGNPHAVIDCPDVHIAPVSRIGSALQQHALFPEQVNVGFMQCIDRHHIQLRVFERGVGETQACGTGACAAVAAGIMQGKLDHAVRVHMQRGFLDIEWSGVGHSLLMTGPAQTVYHGMLA